MCVCMICTRSIYENQIRKDDQDIKIIKDTVIFENYYIFIIQFGDFFFNKFGLNEKLT